MLNSIELKEARDFWKNSFGETVAIFRNYLIFYKTIEVIWRTFWGAYQEYAGRLGVTKSRGLKKLLCGGSDMVSLYQFRESIENFSEFPFSGNLLEKIVSIHFNQAYCF